MAGFDRYLHTVLTRAQQEAGEDGSDKVEAQHLLIAIAAVPERVTHEVLATAGLDDERAVRDVLEREFQHSLSVVGISPQTYDLPRPTRFAPRHSMSTSAKLAIERGFASVTRKRDMRPAHLLLGVLSAQVGTVPRALEIAGIDRDDLLDRLRAALSS